MLALKQPATGARLSGSSLLVWAGGIALAAATAFWLARAHVPTVSWASVSNNAVVLSSSASAEGRWLGMRLEDCPAGSEKASGPGVVVLEVQSGSPAALAGVQAGDVILFLQDQFMSNTQQVADVFRTLPPQAAVMLEVTRSGSYLVLTLNAH